LDNKFGHPLILHAISRPDEAARAL
jgi:hypothetical protein